MAIKADEITSAIKKQIDEFDIKTELQEVGTVMQIGDGIARVYGLESAMNGELLVFPENTYGMVLNLESDSVGVALMGRDTHIKEGDPVKRTKRIMEVPVGEAMIGRVVNPLGQPIDGKGPIKTNKTRPVEVIAPGVIARASVREPLQTGIKAIDSMIPVGRGQRELIIGDRQTGKTAIAIDTIINAVFGSLFRRGHGRRIFVARQARALRLRRLVEARASLPADVAVAAAPAGPRGVSGRRFLSPFSIARARL
jgi:F-type H+-transporting ATPase subunit alpha